MALQQVKETTNQAYSPRRQTLDRYMNNTGRFVSNLLINHWATLITFTLGILVFAALSVPFLAYFGLDGISKQIFFSLHLVCAQIPSHSFYIFGHQLGMCARNFSIYASMFIGSLIFVFSKKRIPGIPWWIWVLLILPLALDGTTQMFGWRESTWELRVLTGTLFGLGNVWFALPLIQKTILESLPTQSTKANESPQAFNKTR
ncbi:MAG TPA: DUF2085 domain-containing protein [Ktedonobacteraceae bacterium]